MSAGKWIKTTNLRQAISVIGMRLQQEWRCYETNSEGLVETEQTEWRDVPMVIIDSKGAVLQEVDQNESVKT